MSNAVTQELLKLLNSNPSDNDLVEGVNAGFKRAGEGVSDADKIAAYDKVAKKIAEIWGNNDEANDGIIYEDSDSMHYLAEEALQAVMGKDIWKVKGIFESC